MESLLGWDIKTNNDKQILYYPFINDIDAQLCLCGSIAFDSESVNDATRRALRTFFNVSEAWLAATLEEADQRLGLDLSPTDVAKILMSGLEGAGLIDRLAGNTQHLDSFRRLTRQLVAKH